MDKITEQEILKNYGPHKAPDTFEMPVFDTPIVSLIVPVYNKYSMTCECLYSIMKNTSQVPYEVIIADDCSTDETQHITDNIKGIKYVCTSRNSGFGKNCTNAVSQAVGKYILFLNNDMLFYTNWLKPMIDKMETDPSVGAVGATLLAPDGRVTELGCVIRPDANIVQIGRNCFYNSTSLETLNHDFDYKSGCSLLLKRSIWDKVGGFDKQFEPAYYEDTDLCLKIKELGLKIENVLQAKIMHYETVSYGDRIVSTRQLCSENRKKFKKKWAKIIQNKDHIDLLQKLCAAYEKYQQEEKNRHILWFEKKLTGRYHIYLFGIKIFSFKKTKKIKPEILIPKETSQKNNKVIYTCITGDYDNLIQHTCINQNYDYVLFTDNKEYLKKKKVGIWLVRPLVFKKGTLSEINRWHKFHPHKLFPNYETSIYIDANINVKTKKLFNDITNIPKDSIISVPKHYKRDCIYDEIEAVKCYELDTPENLKKHTDFLQQTHFPKHFGLGENNVIWRKHNDKRCIKIMNDWWDTLQRYSKRDQLSLFYVLWKNNEKINYLSDLNYRIDTVNFDFFGHLKQNKNKRTFESEV